jgi:predicted component of type VI protein secretion system
VSAVQHPGASRFRLRFMLQEFALGPGDTFIGRNHECQITIFDPLISRKHARIRVFGDRAVLEDLGSRNGCRVNGAVIQGAHPLTPGDRIRIGKHELVFSEVTAAAPAPRERQTGSLVVCAGCETVYSGEMGMCPSCWSREAIDEQTHSGVFDDQGKESWAVDLLLELFNKAMSSERPVEADRVMRQIMAALEAQLKAGARPAPERVHPVASASILLANAQNDGFWPQWAADFHVRAGIAVPAALTAATTHWESLPKPR